MNFLGDWQFWGVVVGIIGVAVTVVIPLLQRNKKKLSYTVLTESALLSVSEEVKGKINITYENTLIQNIHLVVIKFENTGNADIASSEFEQATIFSFPGSEILSMEVVDVSPKNLKPVVSRETSMISIDPILLNKKDHITIKLLFLKYQNKIEVDARILGIKEVGRIDTKESNTNDGPRMGGVSLLFESLYVLFVIMFLGPSMPVWFLALFITMTLSFFSMVYPFIRNKVFAS